MDTVSKEQRSKNMSRIKSRDTGPEKTVRSVLHAMGCRFRLHRKDLPGTPDIVLPKYKAVIQVHGCYWHRHPGCKRTTTPSTNTEFWLKKFAANVERDQRTRKALDEAGWRVMVVWQCETKDLESLRLRLKTFLENREPCR